MPFIQFPFPFKSKEFVDLGIHEDIEEGIFKIQHHTHFVMLEPFPDSSDTLHFEVNVTNELVEFLQIQHRSPFVRVGVGHTNPAMKMASLEAISMWLSQNPGDRGPCPP